jgi:hypothetical protein
MYAIDDPKIYEVIDALTPELVDKLAKEAFENTFS